MEHASNQQQGFRYLAILVWGITTTLVSLAFASVTTRVFKLPSWARLAMTFNNTTSLPLLLVSSLATTNLLDGLDKVGGATSRANSYFLVNSMVSNSLTFAIGPKMLNGFDEDGPYDNCKADDIDEQIDAEAREAEEENEETSLLPSRVVSGGTRAQYSVYKKGVHLLHRLPPWAQTTLDFLYQFVNPPVIGAVLGATIGLVPALHRLFFNSQEDGGYFNAWLTSALKNVGGLFAALQVVLTGVKLSQSLVQMKNGEQGGTLPPWTFALITVFRFFIWPAVSIPIIYLLAKKTALLGDDPILWFTMMLMPTGPSALILTALADVSGAEEEQKFTIAKFLTVSRSWEKTLTDGWANHIVQATYAISPIIFLTVVGSLKAAEAAAGV